MTRVSRKSQKIALLIHAESKDRFDPHYVGFFECFNRQQFFEAHEVLEELWLAQRGTTNGLFYKALIQLAGAFVHIQKERRHPAVALFRLASQNLQKYPALHESLDVAGLLVRISGWVESLDTGAPGLGSFGDGAWPRLALESRPVQRES